MDDETAYWLSFSVFPGVGPVRFALLHSHFGSAKEAFTAPPQELRATGLSETLVGQLVDFRKKLDIAVYIRKLEQLNVTVLTLRNPAYPKLLREISDPPFVLYVKGARGVGGVNFDKTIGVVGTRAVTPYGDEITRRLTSDLVSSGFTIVSGMAYGVDAVAHRTAIADGGDTVAVLGCGIDIVAPSRNADVYAAIAKGSGVIVSEMPLGMRAEKGLFPARNRIISGLSRGVLVTEGADDSGSLITARYAAEQGREVFAVPGPITSAYSRGPAKLLKSGAKLVENVDDILEELGESQVGRGKISRQRGLTGLNETERQIGLMLEKNAMHIDEIVRSCGLTTGEVAATISILEVKGVVRDYGNGVFGLV